MESRFLGDTKLVVLDRVWAIIRDFNEFPSWHSDVCDSSIEDGRPSDAVGRVRSLYLKSGGYFRERLLTCRTASTSSPIQYWSRRCR